jgi:hypothetical protein
MTLLLQLLYFASFLTPLLAPFFYKCERTSMLTFYRRMTVSPSFRKLYTLVLTLYLLAFHFYHLSLYNHPSWLIPSTLMTLLTYSHSFCEHVFNLMQHKRAMLGCVTAAVLCLLIPAFLPLGFTTLVLAVAAVFYPSHLLRDEVASIADKRRLWHEDPDIAIFKYFRWDLMEGSDVQKTCCMANDFISIMDQISAMGNDDTPNNNSHNTNS